MSHLQKIQGNLLPEEKKKKKKVSGQEKLTVFESIFLLF
jgi:hypothetical protein